MLTSSFLLPWRRILPSLCSRSEGRHGQSRWWRATSLSWIFVPVPSFWVEPRIILLFPLLKSSNIDSLWISLLASWIKHILSSGIPLLINSSLMYGYTEKRPLEFGVPMSQNIICVPLMLSLFLNSSYTCSIHLLTLLSASLGALMFSSLGSSPSSLASFVIFNILSDLGSTFPLLISLALITNSFIISFVNSVDSDEINLCFPPLSFGTGSLIISAVWMSAMFLNMVISSGRLVNFENLLLYLYPVPSGASSKLDTTSPNCAAHASKWCIFLFVSSSFCRYLCMMYISVMELEIGVPVANTTPLPSFISLMYWVFISMSDAFLALVLDMPATFRILENTAQFLNWCASSK